MVRCGAGGGGDDDGGGGGMAQPLILRENLSSLCIHNPTTD